MATTKRAKPVVRKRTSAPKAQAKVRLSEADVAVLDDENGFGPDDPETELAKLRGPKKSSKRTRKIDAKPIPLGPLAFGMARVEICGHTYRTYGAVNVYTIAATANTKRHMSMIMYRDIFGEAPTGDHFWERLLAFSEDNPTEYGMRAHAATFDAVFVAEGDAPRMSEVMATLDIEDPAFAIVVEHMGFFNASASAR